MDFHSGRPRAYGRKPLGLRSLRTCICRIYACFRPWPGPPTQVYLLKRSDRASCATHLTAAECNIDTPTAVPVAVTSSIRWSYANYDACSGSNVVTLYSAVHSVSPLRKSFNPHPFHHVTSPFPFFINGRSHHPIPCNSDSPVPYSCKSASSTVTVFNRIYIHHLFTFHSFLSHNFFFDRSNCPYLIVRRPFTLTVCRLCVQSVTLILFLCIVSPSLQHVITLSHFLPQCIYL